MGFIRLTFFAHAALLLLLLVSCGGGTAPPVTGNKWTVMVYMAADNDLEVAAPYDLEEMQQIGSTPNVTLLVQYDTRSTPTRRYLVEHGKLTLLEELSELNMADPATLRDFIVAGVQGHPADHYALIVWDHGDGWQTKVDKQAFSLIEDWGNGGTKSLPMTNRQVADGIRAAEAVTGKQLDLMGVDACIMATLEAAYEFRNVAGILVASQDIVQGFGWDYQDLFARLTANPVMTPRELAVAMVESYRQFAESPAWGYGDQTMSAISLGPAVESLARETDAVARALRAKLDDPLSRDATVKGITDALAATQKFQTATYVDLQDFAVNLDAVAPTAALQGGVRSAIIAAYHGAKRPRANGINIVFFDLSEAIRFSTYAFDYTDVAPVTGRLTQTAFISDFTWDDMMNAYFALNYPDLVRK